MATNKWAILGGVALNVEYTRKYAFDATAAAKVTAKLVAVPPPSLFQDAIQADMAGRVRRASVSTDAVTATTTRATSSRPVIGSPTASSEEGGTAGENEQGFKPLVLLVEEHTGIDYTLDDGVTEPRRGRVDADGVLSNQISTRATRFVITFADGSEPLELILDEPTLDDEEEASTARALVDRKLRTVRGTPEAVFRRLVGMLARKGYPAGVAIRAVKEALAARDAEAAEFAGQIDADALADEAGEPS